MKNLLTTICLTLAVLLGSAGVGHALPPCPGSPLEITSPQDTSEWHYCDGQLTVASSVPNFAGDKYLGEFRNGKPHGQGTYTAANGDKYVGEYRDNKRHGQGT